MSAAWFPVQLPWEHENICGETKISRTAPGEQHLGGRLLSRAFPAVTTDSRCIHAESEQQKSTVRVFNVHTHTHVPGGGARVHNQVTKNLQAGFKDPRLQSACDRLCEKEGKEGGLTLALLKR